ncbi:MAG: helix-turn-helix domain-containing protein [Lachnospiraceae bacterium]|nr:helix-turn-helix domain-containing protein [Lachnospiraceae bacterium]
MDLSNLKKLRREKGILQKDIAKYLGITIASYSLYENSKRTPPIEILQKLCTFYNVDLELLLGWRDPQQTRIVYSSTDGNLEDHTGKYPSLDFALQKFQNKEDLTYEEEDAIIEYVESEQFKQEKEDIKQIAQKAYDYISYMHSHSFASSAEELDRLKDAKQIELEKQRAKPFKLYETAEAGPPKPFTRPLQSSYDKPNEPQQDNSLKLHTNSDAINWEQLDDFRFYELMLKLDRGEELTPEEINFKSAYLERCLKRVGDIFAKFYSMLNVEGQKKADEQIDRAIEQVELLTKIPEYQKKLNTPPQE